MKNDDTNKQEKKFPVREGSDNSAVQHGKTPLTDGKYPKPETKDNQANNQPEFTEEQPNKQSPNSPANSKK